MRDEIVIKTVPLNIARGPENIATHWTKKELLDHSLRIQAHADRVEADLDAIKEKDPRSNGGVGDRKERDLANSRKYKDRMRAKKRAAGISERKANK